MQSYKFFPTDWYAECIWAFLQWLVRALGLKCPRMGLPSTLLRAPDPNEFAKL